jgi:Spx/MgsR family transcriptional regulator
MKLYGIKNCDSVKKAVKYLKELDIAYEFIDLKQDTMDRTTIQKWLESTQMKRLFNSRSTTYRTLGLKELNLEDKDKLEWLIKEPMLIKRPVIEFDDGSVMVGFNTQEYNQKFH